MKRLFALMGALLILSGAPLFAQDNPDDEDEVTFASYSMNQSGDQYINIALQVTFPQNFGGSFPSYRDGQLQIGGSGMLGYHRFLTSWFALGVDICFGYNPTIGENIFTYIPIVLDATFQPSWRSFEFPVTLGVGAAMETYLSRSYFPGLTLKASAGVFYRATASWSFGAQGDYMVLPQWYDDSKYNFTGRFASVQLCARYHF